MWIRNTMSLVDSCWSTHTPLLPKKRTNLTFSRRTHSQTTVARCSWVMSALTGAVDPNTIKSMMDDSSPWLLPHHPHWHLTVESANQSGLVRSRRTRVTLTIKVISCEKIRFLCWCQALDTALLVDWLDPINTSVNVLHQMVSFWFWIWNIVD